MALETVIGIAIAMGRTLVMPPAQKMYLLQQGRGQQKTHFGFADFFNVEQMAAVNDGLEIITTKQFLEMEAMKGNLRDKTTGEVSFPPGNQTDWDGENTMPLKEWLRNVTHIPVPVWKPERCLAAFPASGNPFALRDFQNQIHAFQPLEGEFLDSPTPVDATPMERMREHLASRKELCVYDEALQAETYIHFASAHKLQMRMLTHYYAFLFFEDWREDLWMKVSHNGGLIA